MSCSISFPAVCRQASSVVFALGVLAATPVAALAADTKAPAAAPPPAASSGAINCETTEKPADLLFCAKRDLSLAEKKMDSLVKKSMETLPVKARPLFETAQKSWQAYRDSDCQWNAYEIETGNSSELIYMTCMADLTSGRIEDLEAGLGGAP